MYEKFFGLEKTPFSTVPDPNCVHLVGQHADAISGLAYGVLSRKGYLVLTGEAGLGKTTALGAMSHLLSDANVQLSLILNPILTAPEFIEMVMLNFGFEQIPVSKAQRLKMLHEFLIRSDREGKVSALIVDEAHKLSADLLEEVRLLGNFEASDHKLLQIVLAGQDELNDRLNLPELWQLKQRMVIRTSLRRLDRDAVEQYLRFRWGKAGGADPMPFTDGAVDAIAAWSHGIPRLVNAICDNALLIAFSEATQTVNVQHIRKACVELDLPTPAIKPRLEPSATPATALRPVQQLVSVAPQGAERHAGPQFWQYSGPSLLEKWLPLSEDIREPAETAGSAPAANQEEQRRLSHRETDPKQFPTLDPAEMPLNSPPRFTTIRQQRQTHFLQPTVLVIVGVIALAGTTIFLLLGRRSAPSVQSIPLMVTTSRLHVEVKRPGIGLVDIQWNPQSAAVAQAKSGRLVITEGNQQPRIVALEPDQLNIGHLSYPFLAERGEFRLEVVDRSGVTATESVLAYLSGTPATPSAAAPPTAQVPSPAPKQPVVSNARAPSNVPQPPPPAVRSVAPPPPSQRITEEVRSPAPEPPPIVANGVVSPPPAPPPANVSSTPPAPPTLSVQDQPPLPVAVRSPLVGSWVASRSAKTASSFAPLSVTLAISETNGQLQGTLTGNYQIPNAINFNPNVALSFRGSGSGALKFPFTTENGSRGTIELIQAPKDPNMIEVVWVPEGQALRFDDLFLKSQ